MDTFTITTTFGPGANGDALAIAAPGVLGTFVTPSRDETKRVLRRLTSRIETLERNALDQWRGEHKESGSHGIGAHPRLHDDRACWEQIRYRAPGRRRAGLRIDQGLFSGSISRSPPHHPNFQ